MDTKALRQKILDLAIHGKLVPQDPNDEPASVLLERIKAEKERLIKEGKIKRSKKSAKTSDTPHYENVPFEVPEGWTICKLSDVCIFENGFAFSSNDYCSSGIPLVRISNILENSICLENCVYIQQEVEKRFVVSKGDLLIALSGATTGKMGTYNLDDIAYLNQRVGNLKVINKNVMLPAYRDVFMRSKTEDILKLAYGGAQPNISGSIIGDFTLLLPPFHEQQRIVAEIEKWFALIGQIEQGKADIQATIKQAKSKILDLAIHGNLVPQDPNDEPTIELLKRINPDFTPCDNGHSGKLPQGWIQITLKSVAEIRNGYAFKSSKYVSKKGVRLIRLANVQDGYIEDKMPQYYPFEEMNTLQDFMLTKGDLLMSLTGNVGRVGILPEELLPAALNQRVACINEYKEIILKKYLYFVFQSNRFSKDCVNAGKGVAQLNISTEWLKYYNPLAELKRA